MRTVFPPVEEATHNILAGNLGIISYLEFLYLYSGMSIGSTLGISSLIIINKKISL